MLYHKHVLTLAAATTFAFATLPVKQAAATTPVYGAAASSGAAPWPVWLLGGGVASLMLRAAYVYRTHCRELTGEEAFTGMVPLWPAYQQSKNQCAPPARSPVVGRY